MEDRQAEVNPRMRGEHGVRAIHGAGALRLIPACAGNTANTEATVVYGFWLIPACAGNTLGIALALLAFAG